MLYKPIMKCNYEMHKNTETLAKR